jgi:hypothetical protein
VNETRRTHRCTKGLFLVFMATLLAVLALGVALNLVAAAQQGVRMYWTDVGTITGNGKIQRADLDGKNVEDLVCATCPPEHTALTMPIGIALDIAGGKMYWTDAGAAKIQRANLLDGSNIEDLVTTGLTTPYGIALEWEQEHTLTVEKAGTGTGTVTSDPAGINCGADCTEVYDGGTAVTLTAIPDARSDFIGWSGGCAGSDPTTTVTMNADTTCTATFNLKQFTLTVNTVDVGGGTGTVTSDPVGINCGADCTEVYDIDTLVTLTAYPGVKSYLVSWSEDCVSTGALTAQVTMDDDKTCTATFGYPVGGIVVPVDKLGLVLPWMGLVGLAGLAALGVVVVRRRGD